MHKSFLLYTVFLVLLFTGMAKAQDKDTLQPDSVYAKNHVRQRISTYAGAISKSKEIFVFDKDGHYNAIILTDNQNGKKPAMSWYYTYNAKHILTAERDTVFEGNKYAVKQVVLSYGEDGSLLKKMVMNGGKVISETVYSAAENKETETLFRDTTPYRVQTSYYDSHGKTTRFEGTEMADKNAKPKVFEFNGKKYTVNPPTEDSKWDYIFENTYDNQGNLILKKRSEKGVVQDETTFVYNNQGLLTEKREKGPHDERVNQFKYVF